MHYQFIARVAIRHPSWIELLNQKRNKELLWRPRPMVVLSSGPLDVSSPWHYYEV